MMDTEKASGAAMIRGDVPFTKLDDRYAMCSRHGKYVYINGNRCGWCDLDGERAIDAGYRIAQLEEDADRIAAGDYDHLLSGDDLHEIARTREDLRPGVKAVLVKAALERTKETK